MIVLSLSNIIYFLPEYIIAAVLSLVSFSLVDRIRKPRINVIVERNESSDDWVKLCSTLFSSTENIKSESPILTGDLTMESGTYSLSTPFRKVNPSYSAALCVPILQKISPMNFGTNYPREKRPSAELFQNKPLFYLYRTALSVTVWSGAFLLMTPFKYLHFFLPSFGSGIDIIIDVILGVSIFESIITAIATHTGKNYMWILVTEFLVVLIASASLFSPAMLWFRLETRLMQVEIYSLLIFLISAITVLAFFVGKRSYTFILSFLFSMIAYSLFIATMVLNIAIFILRST